MADFSSLTAAMKELTYAFKSFAGSSQGGGGGFSSGVTGIAGGAVAGGLAGAAKSAPNPIAKAAWDLGDVLAKLSKGFFDLDTYCANVKVGLGKLSGVVGTLGNQFHKIGSSMMSLGASTLKSSIESEKEIKLKKESISLYTRLGIALNWASAGLTGLVMSGLQGTVEGYRLGLAFKRLSFEIADLMVGPINSFTNGLIKVVEGFNALDAGTAGLLGNIGAAIIGFGVLNKTLTMLGMGGTAAFAISAATIAIGTAYYTISRSMKDASLEPGEKGNIGFFKPRVGSPTDVEGSSGPIAWLIRAMTGDGTTHRVAINESQAKLDRMGADPRFKEGREAKFGALKEQEEKDKREHLNPMYRVNFGALESLWQNTQKMVTEDPGLVVATESLTVLKEIRDKDVPKDEAGPMKEG